MTSLEFVDLQYRRSGTCRPIPRTSISKVSISIAQYPEIRDWCSHFGCTGIELAEAIAVVGYSPDLVRVFLAEKAVKASA